MSVDREDFKKSRSLVYDRSENTDRKTKDNERGSEKGRGYMRSIQVKQSVFENKVYFINSNKNRLFIQIKIHSN